MVRHFFLDKVNTIFKGKYANLGLNPVMELNYGKGPISRVLMHFDEKPILSLVEDRTFVKMANLGFKLKMTNCFSVDGYPYAKELMTGLEPKQRAASFDIILFELPCYFDEGRGFDFVSDFWITNNRSFDDNASNWYFSQNGNVWPVDKEKIDLNNPNLNLQNKNVWVLEDDGKKKIHLDGGVYSQDYINEQYELFKNGEESIIIGEQHFDYGNENIDIDISDYVMKIINGKHNYGIGMMFTPRIENQETIVTQYVGFFSNHTNTFFHPYVEAIYCNHIDDNRDSFCPGKENKLYLYTFIDGQPIALDNIPTCMINDVEYPVEMEQKGYYSITIPASDNSFESGTIGYDVWSNLMYDGVSIDDVEMEFEVQPKQRYFSVGNSSNTKHSYVPTVYGINDGELVNRGEEREITVDFRVEYETNRKVLLDSAEYRLYVMDGTREIDVIKYQPIEKGFLNNYFMIYTEDLVPNDYYIDIKTKIGRETKYYRQILRFTVASDVTERYE